MSIHVRNQRRIHVAAPAAIAFQFFTPLGEQLWIDEWRPHYVNPPSGLTTAGMVFTTGEGDRLTIWQLIEFDQEGRKACYARTMPAGTVGTVRVQATPLDSQNTEVLVQYDMTALAPAASQALENYRDPAFSQMMDSWQEKIRQRMPELLQAFA